MLLTIFFVGVFVFMILGALTRSSNGRRPG
jgi:hypothetical protein